MANGDESDSEELHNIIEPDWKKCFKDGCSILMENSELEKLREDYKDEIEHWYNSQISSGKIQTQDYKTGELITIIDLSYNPGKNLEALIKNSEEDKNE